MKKMTYLTLLSVFLSCSNHKLDNETLTTIVVDPSKVEKAFDIAEFVSNEFDIIPLETTDESLIGNIAKIIFKNGIYYVMDTQTNSVILFDEHGKYLSKLNKIGQGPDEYTQMSTLVIVGNELWISDTRTQSLMGYDGNFRLIKRITLWDYIDPDHTVYMDGKIYMASNWMGKAERNIQLASYDCQTGDLEGLIYVPGRQDNIPSWRLDGQLSQSGDSCLFMYLYCDSIFQIKNNQAFPKYNLVFTERYKNIPYTIEDFTSPENRNIIKQIEKIQQIKDNILFGYIDGTKYHTAIYNSGRHQTRVYSMLTNSNLNMIIYPYATYMTDEDITVFYEPDQIIENIKTHFISDLAGIPDAANRKKIENVIASLTDESNPVLVRFKIK